MNVQRFNELIEEFDRLTDYRFDRYNVKQILRHLGNAWVHHGYDVGWAKSLARELRESISESEQVSPALRDQN